MPKADDRQDHLPDTALLLGVVSGCRDGTVDRSRRRRPPMPPDRLTPLVDGQ
ncbi:hypothetical protein [Cellulomonas sp. P24]|uniref:hypothetical protein n=1 Tax=Cellulomonas sp. P24 TaxID=2885206 RepID=UPI00216AC9FA|nr:hypothetical protein [Cellulomonas sp. P24]MCR6493170.1 hypothetical protein [Cellulomonas sp. P24]